MIGVDRIDRVPSLRTRLPAGALLLPVFAGILLSDTHFLSITLPPWLMAGCYVLVGWTIGRSRGQDIRRQQQCDGDLEVFEDLRGNGSRRRSVRALWT